MNMANLELRSSRHRKIAGDFGEIFVLYCLSKYGFECAKVDHVGIDVIARNPLTRELMGIAVTARSRTEKTGGTHVSRNQTDIEKVQTASRTFGCKPYFAAVVDANSTIRAFISPLHHVQKLSGARIKKFGLGMQPRDVDGYRIDNNVIVFENGKCWHESRLHRSPRS